MSLMKKNFFFITFYIVFSMIKCRVEMIFVINSKQGFPKKKFSNPILIECCCGKTLNRNRQSLEKYFLCGENPFKSKVKVCILSNMLLDRCWCLDFAFLSNYSSFLLVQLIALQLRIEDKNN